MGDNEEENKKFDVFMQVADKNIKFVHVNTQVKCFNNTIEILMM
jgi:hypothetical protein